MQYKKQSILRRIADAAKAEFLSRGFDGCSIKAIIVRSGITVGNFYRYYGGKLDVLTDIVKDAYGGIPPMVKKTVRSVSGAENRVELIAQSVAGLIDMYGDELRILVFGCRNTPYADFTDVVAAEICDLFSFEGDDRRAATLVSKGFVYSLTDLTGDDKSLVIQKTIQLTFGNMKYAFKEQ